MNKAVFLDRDGIINEEKGDYISRLEDFTILPDVGAALKELTDRGYLLFVITNQGGIAKKLYDDAEVEKMHEYLASEMNRLGVSFAEMYYCPHHPDYSGKCLCRKPGSLMVEKAIAIYDINPSLSYFIGDKERDVIAGEGAGVKGIQVPSNTSFKEILPLIK